MIHMTAVALALALATPESSEVARAERSFEQAIVGQSGRDVAWWLDPRFSWVGADGRLGDRTTFLAHIRETAESRLQLESFTGAAVVLGTFHSGPDSGRFTRIWIRSPAGWRVFAYQATRASVASMQRDGSAIDSTRNAENFIAVPPRLSADQSQVLQAFRDLQRAEHTGDARTFAGLTANEFHVIGTRGQVNTKQGRVQAVDAVRAPTSYPLVHDVRITIVGDAAVMQAVQELATITASVRFLRVWIRRGGRWQQAVNEQTIIASTPSVTSGNTAHACNTPAPVPIVYVPVPGNPFEAIATPDGCALFVSLMRMPTAGDVGIAVLHRDSGRVTLAHVIPLQQSPRGMVLTHDGKVLIVAADSAVVFVDVPRALEGDPGAVVGQMKEQQTIQRIMVSVTRDDRWLFVSNEHDSSVAVIDLAAARRNGFPRSAMIGTIPVGIAPITLELSPDEHYMYTTSEAVREGLGWPIRCKPEGTARKSPPHAVGTVSVIDVERATRDPAHGVIASAPAACSPVRLVLSPGGDIAYVTARNSDAVLAFNTRKLREDPEHALIDSVAVGTAPVGVVLIDGGKRIVVANSNRFGDAAKDQELSVLDASNGQRHGMRAVGRIPAGRFPRELHLTPDGHTLLVTNFNSRTVELVRLPLDTR